MTTGDYYTIHLANTLSGEYDPRLPVPVPLQCDPRTGRIVRGYPNLRQVIGFVDDPDETDVLTWHDMAGMDSSADFADAVYGLFPVVIETSGDIATLTLPVTKLTSNGVEL